MTKHFRGELSFADPTDVVCERGEYAWEGAILQLKPVNLFQQSAGFELTAPDFSGAKYRKRYSERAYARSPNRPPLSRRLCHGRSRHAGRSPREARNVF